MKPRDKIKPGSGGDGLSKDPNFGKKKPGPDLQKGLRPLHPFKQRVYSVY